MNQFLQLSANSLGAPEQAVPMISIKNLSGVQGLFNVAHRLSQEENLTLADIGKRYGESILVPQIIGTPVQIADRLEAIFTEGACDGFIISPAYLPGSFDEFVQSVVPELQRRGLFREEYSGKTLRDHLGLGKANLTPRRAESIAIA